MFGANNLTFFLPASCTNKFGFGSRWSGVYVGARPSQMEEL
jgi:hypothetical protein